jgi:hypothetical protein
MKNLEEIQNVIAIVLKRVKTSQNESNRVNELKVVKVQIEKGNKSPNRKGK